MSRYGRGWQLRTSSGMVDADFCIVATGARNALPEVGTKLTPEDTMSALGYYVPGDQTHIDIQFLPRLEGYIWVFPRCGHLSVGICGKGEPASSLRKRLERYLTERGSPGRARPFTAICCRRSTRHRGRRTGVAGEGWMAVGDAAGLVDPVTGEAYTTPFARRTWRRARCFPRWRDGREGRPIRQSLRRDFAADLEFGSRLAKRVFLGRFLFGPCRRAWCSSRAAARDSRPSYRTCFAGKQPYLV